MPNKGAALKPWRENQNEEKNRELEGGRMGKSGGKFKWKKMRRNKKIGKKKKKRGFGGGEIQEGGKETL